MIPNADVYTSPITVLTQYEQRRVKFVVGVAYSESVDNARDTIMRVVNETDGVLPEPGPWVYLEELASSSMDFGVYFWTESPQANVLAVRDRVASRIKRALDDANISIPFPHRVVFFHNETPGAGDDAAAGRVPDHGTPGADGDAAARALGSADGESRDPQRPR